MTGSGGLAGRRVLVTGATGLLGSHLVQASLARGAEVVCLVRDWVPRARTVEEGWIERAVLVRGELEDLGALVRTLNEHEIDAVLHTGAQTIVGTAARSPVSTFESNVRGTWNLLEACRTLGGTVRRIVVLSSDKAYGVADRLPYTEETPLRGRSPYDASKAAADLVAASYFHAFGLPVSIARCANLYGPGDLNWNRLVPETIRAALGGRRPVIRSDGKYLRDWFFVEDAAAAVILLAERIGEPGIAGEAFNFGTERAVPVIEVVRTILRLAERPDLEPAILDQARDEIRDQSLDCSKARERLSWRAAHDLEDGLRKTIAWYRERWPQG